MRFLHHRDLFHRGLGVGRLSFIFQEQLYVVDLRHELGKLGMKEDGGNAFHEFALDQIDDLQDIALEAHCGFHPAHFQAVLDQSQFKFGIF